MDPIHRANADRVRARLARGESARGAFRAALLEVPPVDRDAWADHVLALGAIPEDGPELPAACVPYLPCPVGDLLHVVDHAAVSTDDVFVDVGAGVGRATALVHLLTGATTVGIEIQPRLAEEARALAARLGAASTTIEGDAAELPGAGHGTVFFLYCPFGGARLDRLLARLEEMARARPIRIGCVDVPLPPCPWLTLARTPRAGVAIHRSTLESSRDR